MLHLAVEAMFVNQAEAIEKVLELMAKGTALVQENTTQAALGLREAILESFFPQEGKPNCI